MQDSGSHFLANTAVLVALDEPRPGTDRAGDGEAFRGDVLDADRFTLVEDQKRQRPVVDSKRERTPHQNCRALVGRCSAGVRVHGIVNGMNSGG